MGGSDSKQEQIDSLKYEVNKQSLIREKEIRDIRERQERERLERLAEEERERTRLRYQQEELRAYNAKREAERLAIEERFNAELREKEEKLKALEAEKQAELERQLKEPWSTFEKGGEWSVSYQDKLIELIKSHENYGELRSARVLFLGPIRAGKSSFINSIASIDKGRIAAPLLAGAADKSMSKKLKQYKPKKILQNFRLLDTMGIEEQEGAGFNIKDVIYVIEGNVKPDYKFIPDKPIDKSDEKSFKENPKLADKSHCIVIVMDSIVIDTDSISDESKKKIKALQQHVSDHDVPTVLILTKIDELCEEVKKDITRTYHSRKVRDVVQKAKELFGVLEMNIFPVKNYSKEKELNHNMNILILLALRRMMQIASDRLENMEDQDDSD